MQVVVAWDLDYSDENVVMMISREKLLMAFCVKTLKVQKTTKTFKIMQNRVHKHCKEKVSSKKGTY